MKIALAIIVKGTDSEALLLNRCLENAAPYVDGIFVTRTTAPGQQKNAAVANVARNYNAHLSDFEWIDDFAAARNFNFSQVPKDYDYILWCDADDMWRGLNKLKKTIKDNPHTDAFGFWYLYDWDEFKKPIVVHRKTMLVKNDNAVKWVGALHEDLEPTRQLDVKLIEGIERLHVTTKERCDDNARRNVRIAEKEKNANPSDPRSYWNLANSQYGISDFDKARYTFERFIALSESDDEKYIAHSRLSDVYKSLGERDKAVRELQVAIGLLPSLPDAYLQLAHLFFTYSDMDKAEQYCLQGMIKRPQTLKMIVFNPRDYDYNPMMLLAKIYYHKNRPDLMLPLLKGCLKIYPNDEHLKKMVAEGTAETKLLAKALTQVKKLSVITDKDKIAKALAKLPPDMQSHPAVAVIRNQHFIKTESTGRDLVYYCGNTVHQWYDGSKGFIGGSEEAVINLSREFASKGWNVTVYNNCGHKPITVNGVTYRPFWEFNYRDKQDVMILWRWAKPLDAEINATKIYIDLHDVPLEGEFTEKRLAKLTKILVKTQFHRSFLPNIPGDKIAIIPNGMAFDTIASNPPIEKDPYLIINTSSPDRSMDVLPTLFKEVKKRVPQARMQWAYGWDIFKQSYAADPKKMAWMQQVNKDMEESGIENLGRLSQEEIGKLYQKASILAYPTEFAEIDCISVKKAQAAGCYPVATDFGALDESIAWGAKVHSEKTKDTWAKPYQFHFGLEDATAQKEWIDACVKALTEPHAQHPSLHKYSWNSVANQWAALL